ncbi:hypothetical protein BJF79_31770 [Actinomadura sp. CNU-125]|nr:hypothetical protein BJF79_31770 [Actinomadura sp. CNU-125]
MYSRTGYARLSAIAHITTARIAARLVSAWGAAAGAARGLAPGGVPRPLVFGCHRRAVSPAG